MKEYKRAILDVRRALANIGYGNDKVVMDTLTRVEQKEKERIKTQKSSKK